METYIKRNNQQIVFFNGGDKYMKHKFTMAILKILGFEAVVKSPVRINSLFFFLMMKE